MVTKNTPSDNLFEYMRDTLLAERYLIKEKGETEEQFFNRVTEFVTRENHRDIKIFDDATKNEVYQSLLNGEIIYNSPILMNAGREYELSGACYVLPVNDNLTDTKDSILNLQTISAKIFKLGAGVGVDYSKLRPEHTPVRSGGTSSGPVSFMKLIDTLAEVVKSGGKRRAAIMSTLRIDHPDIETFIHIKDDNKTLQNTNISIMMTDDFMSEVVKGGDSNYELKYKDTVKLKNVKELWNDIIKSAWKTGDPGLVFIDTINKLTPKIFDLDYEAVNACSEYALYPYESCLIGTLNLAKMYDPLNNTYDVEKIQRKVCLLVDTLDNVIDNAWFPDEEIEKSTKLYRRIGVGITGLGDLLIKMKVPYDSEEGRKIAGEIMKLVTKTAIKESERLAEILGPFPAHDKYVPCITIYKRVFGEDYKVKLRRNIAVTVVAPTGSTSIICRAECSGIEPMYALGYRRMMRLGNNTSQWFNVVSPLLYNELKTMFSEEKIQQIIEKIIENGGSIANIDEIPDEMKRYYKTAHEISPMDHLLMMAEIQKYTENSISKTINLPNDATVEDVANIYITAWQLGCKGITIFRDGCKGEQVYVTSKEKDNAAKSHTKKSRPDILDGKSFKMSLPQGSLYVTITLHENKPFELFAILGKSGLDHHAYCEALGRLISLALRSGIEPETVANSLKGIRGRDWGLWGDEYIWSVPHALGIALEYTVKELEENGTTKETKHVVGNSCPECGGKLVSDNGCLTCISCGYSKCSA